MKIKGSLIVLMVLFVVACSHKTTTTTTTQIPEKIVPELTEVQLQGKAIYLANCGNCHKAYDPERNTYEGWQKDVNRMQKRAKITDGEKELILNYLSVLAKK